MWLWGIIWSTGRAGEASVSPVQFHNGGSNQVKQLTGKASLKVFIQQTNWR